MVIHYLIYLTWQACSLLYEDKCCIMDFLLSKQSFQFLILSMFVSSPSNSLDYERIIPYLLSFSTFFACLSGGGKYSTFWLDWGICQEECQGSLWSTNYNCFAYLGYLNVDSALAASADCVQDFVVGTYILNTKWNDLFLLVQEQYNGGTSSYLTVRMLWRGILRRWSVSCKFFAPG